MITAIQLKNLRQLHRLRDMRVQMAMIEVQRARKQLEDAKKAVIDCKKYIESLQAQLVEIAELVRINPQIHAVQYQYLTEARIKNIEFLIQQNEDRLLELIEQRTGAVHALQIANEALARATARRDAVVQQRDKARLERSLWQEEMQLLELDGLKPTNMQMKGALA
jgi:hypothetical protein